MARSVASEMMRMPRISVDNRTYKHELTEKGFEARALVNYFKK